MRNTCTFVGVICCGVLATIAVSTRAQKEANQAQAAGEQAGRRELYGKVLNVKGTMITLQTKSGTTVAIESARALEAHRSVPVAVGRAIRVNGTYDKKGVLQADSIQWAKNSPVMWPADK
jgi:hypothetical protein